MPKIENNVVELFEETKEDAARRLRREKKRAWVKANPEKYRAQQRRWYHKNIERIRKSEADRKRAYYKKFPHKYREKSLHDSYGLTVADYDRLCKAQYGVCAICKKPESECRQGVLHIDHDHTTGVVRGLLCELCNRMLGNAKDNPDRLIAAAHYLIEKRNA